MYSSSLCCFCEWVWQKPWHSQQLGRQDLHPGSLTQDPLPAEVLCQEPVWTCLPLQSKCWKVPLLNPSSSSLSSPLLFSLFVSFPFHISHGTHTTLMGPQLQLHIHPSMPGFLTPNGNSLRFQLFFFFLAHSCLYLFVSKYKTQVYGFKMFVPFRLFVYKRSQFLQDHHPHPKREKKWKYFDCAASGQNQHEFLGLFCLLWFESVTLLAGLLIPGSYASLLSSDISI